MNITLLIFVLFIVVLTIICYYTNSNTTEKFSNNILSLVKNRKRKMSNKQLSNIDNICSQGLTCTHIFQGRVHHMLYLGKQVNKIDIDNRLELPEHWESIDLLAKHTNNKLFVIKDSGIFFVDDFNTNYSIHDLYPNVKMSKFKGILQINNQTLLFYEDKVIRYNNTNNMYTINDLYKGVPKDYNRVFEFYLEPLKERPLPILIFIRNNHLYRYDLNTNTLINNVGFKFNGEIPLKSQVLDFKTLGSKGIFGPSNSDILKTPLDIDIKDGVQKMIVNEKQQGNYRLEVLGAGQKNGGFGARIFKDLTLNTGDIVEVSVGQSGLRLPSQDTQTEKNSNKLNNFASSSGSGASTVKINGEIVAISGGGGGFTSGILTPPKISHASVTSKSEKANLSIPIKRIVFKLPPSMFTIIHYNKPFTKLNSNEFYFKEPLIDFKINYKQTKPSSVTLYDINDNKIVICENISVLTPEIVLIEALGYTPLSLRNLKEPVRNKFCKEGTSILNLKKGTSVNKNATIEKTEGHVILYGGFNGGGVSTMDIKTAISHAGGGGGAQGGKSSLNSFVLDVAGKKHLIEYLDNNNIVIDKKRTIHTPLSIGSGGSSFIESNFNTFNFTGNFNEADGKVLFIKYNSDYYDSNTETFNSFNHQKVTSEYILSHYNGSLTKKRTINKIILNKNIDFNQLRIRILFNLDDITTENLNPMTTDMYIKLQPVFFKVDHNQLLRFDVPSNSELLDTIVPENILFNVPFNEELKGDSNKLSSILTEDLHTREISKSGKLNIKNSTLEYSNFYNIKDSKRNLTPTELYLIIEAPLNGLDYDLVTIQCNNEDMDKHDYLFNKILKKSD